MAAQKKRRPGAGRKPKEATILKRKLIENKVVEAEASFAFLVEVRDSKRWPKNLRFAAATAILDRVLGRPKSDDALTLRGVVATEDVGKLSPDARVKRIAELLERAGSNRTARLVGTGPAGSGDSESYSI